MAEGYARATTAAVEVSASIVLGAVVAAILDPVLGVVLLGGALVVVVWRRPWADGAARPSNEPRLSGRSWPAQWSPPYVRAPELVAYGRQDLVEDALEQVRRRAAAVSARRALAGGLARAGTILAAGGAVVAVVGAGLAAADAHRLSGVTLAVVAFATLAVMDQCTGLPAVFAGNNAARAAAARLRDLERLAPAVEEPELDHSAGAIPGRAELAEAETTSPAGDRILKGVSLSVGDGERVALVGPSGAGKTSAVHALLHFVACAGGHAYLGGVDVSTMTRQGIATLAGWLPEATHLFAASVADNLRVGRPGASGPECLAVLERVGLRRWADGLPQGLATRLGAGGLPMSAGERQRLGLARVLLAGPSLLLLDEPTAHLDPATAVHVLGELLDATEDRSALVVSHDPAVARYVDKVVALDGGRVVGLSPGDRSGYLHLGAAQGTDQGRDQAVEGVLGRLGVHLKAPGTSSGRRDWPDAGDHGRQGRRPGLVKVAVDRRRRSEADGVGRARGRQQGGLEFLGDRTVGLDGMDVPSSSAQLGPQLGTGAGGLG